MNQNGYKQLKRPQAPHNKEPWILKAPCSNLPKNQKNQPSRSVTKEQRTVPILYIFEDISLPSFPTKF